MRSPSAPFIVAGLQPAPALPQTPTQRVAIAAAFGLMVVIWGTTWLAIRIGLESYPPFFSVAVRFLIAGPAFLLIMRIRGDRIPWELRAQPLFLTLGVLSFVISFGVVYWGEQYLASGLTAVIFALMPLLTGIVAHYLLPQEPLRRSTLLGLLVGLIGIVLLNLSDLGRFHPRAPQAALVVLVSPVVVAVASVLAKKHLHEYPVLSFSALPMTYGGIAHAALWFLFERDVPLSWSWPGVGTIAYLIVFGSMVTFASYYYLLERVKVSRLNLVAYLTPIIALAVGVLFGGEILTPAMMLGAALVLGGVAVANRTSGGK